jgi:hypothetical protein
LRVAASHHASFHCADQDDVWEAEKVAHAHHVVTQNETPTLYHCRQQLIDNTGRLLKLSRLAGPGSFQNAICENIAVGCTVALNHSAAQFVAKGNPAHILMHDWWAYLVVSAVGRIEYDKKPWIQYRKHAQNVIGGNRGMIHQLLWRLQRFATRSGGVGRI